MNRAPPGRSMLREVVSAPNTRRVCGSKRSPLPNVTTRSKISTGARSTTIMISWNWPSFASDMNDVVIDAAIDHALAQVDEAVAHRVLFAGAGRGCFVD